MKGDTLGNAVGAAADRASDVRAVAVAVVAVLPVADGIVGDGSASTELRVRDANARVYDVSVNASAGRRVVVGAVERAVALVYAVEAPRRAGLCRVGRDDTILFNILDSRVLTESDRIGFR